MSHQSEKLCDRWKGRIEQERKEHERWRTEAEEADLKYYDDDNTRKSQYASDYQERPFNLFYANTQIMHSALLTHPPAPEVRRRHSDQGAGEKLASKILERAIAYSIDTAPFAGPLGMAVEDFLVSGRGSVRVNYDPEVEEFPVPGPDGEPLLDDDGEIMLAPQIVSQNLSLEFFHWKDFGYEPAKAWEDVDWVYFRHKLTKTEIKDQFGVDVNATQPEDDKKKHKLSVYEIWNRPKREIIFIADEHNDVLETREDKLNLEHFFPCCRPLMANCRRNDFLPVPYYRFYKDLDSEANDCARRLRALTKAAKYRGLADAEITRLAREMGTKNDGEMIPVEGLAQLMQENGARALSDLIAEWPIKTIVELIGVLQDRLDYIKNLAYEITGISDIVRGASHASETATAQQIKGQWANVRLTRPQGEVNRYCRGVFRIMAELIAEHYEPELLAQMTNTEPQQAAAALDMIREDLARSFIVDVETDSTIARDEAEEREGRQMMLNELAQSGIPLVQAAKSGFLPMDVAKEGMLSIARGSKHGRNLEDAILSMDGTNEQMQQFQQQTQQLQQQLQQYAQAYQELQKQLQEVNQREQQRKDMEAQAEAFGDKAEGEKDLAQAEHIRAETQMIGQQPLLVGL